MGCCEDLGEGADGLRWVGDAVVEDEEGGGRGEGRDYEGEAWAKSRSLTPLAKCASGFRDDSVKRGYKGWQKRRWR